VSCDDLTGALHKLIAAVVTATSIVLIFNKTGYPGSPGKMAVKTEREVNNLIQILKCAVDHNEK